MAEGRGDSDSGVGTMSSPGDADVTVKDVYLRISIPDAHTEKSMQFKSDDPVWTVKQRVLAACGELKDSLNYGLYVPSSKVKAGKFLDEERPLLDYPFASPVGLLELRYKKRQYKDSQFDQKKLRQLHTKSNFKLFMSAVKNNDVEKVESWTSKGLDPNFQDADTGETPMTLCCSVVVKCRNMLLALYAGGAFVDYRNREGLTPMHRAAEKGNSVAIKTLLDLGASTNYKDARNLTPLYLCVMNTMDTNCAQMLLHDHSVVDTVDAAGFTETHQACKDGRSSHVDQLLFYGADIDAQNSSGNTPLHICSLNNQLSCARILLFRGADRTIQNRDGQDAFHAAILAGNKELADLIRNYSPNDIVLHQEEPKLNEKRRGTQTTVRRRVRQIPSVYNVFGTLSESATDPNLSSRASDTESNVPRTIVLQRGAAGFGFVLSGMKSGVSEGRTVLPSFKPTPQTPAAQFFENVDPGSAAEKAGIRKGDFVLEINGEDVRSASHEYTVRLVKETRETLIVKVIAPKVTHPKVSPYNDGTQTLPLKRGAPHPPVRGTNSALSPSSGASMQEKMTAELDKLDKFLASHDTEEPVYAPVIKVPPPPTVSAASTDINGNNVKTASIGHRHGKKLTASLSTENFQTFGKTAPEVTTTSATYATYSSTNIYSLPANKRSDSVPNLALAASRQHMVAIDLDDDDKTATSTWNQNMPAPPSRAYSSATINSNVPYYVEEALNRTRETEEMAARLDPPAGYANSPVRYNERSTYTSSEVGGTGYRYDSGNIDDNRSSLLYKTQSSRDRDDYQYSTVRRSAPVSLPDDFSLPASSYLPPSVNGQARGRDKSDAYPTNYSDMSQYYTPPRAPPANNSYSKPSASIAGYSSIPSPPPLPPVAVESKPQPTARVNGQGTISGIPAELQASGRKQDTAHFTLMAEIRQRGKRIASEDGDSGERQFADKKNYSTGKLSDSSALSSVRSNKSKSVVELSTGGGNYLSTAAEPSLVPLRNGNRQVTDNRPTSAVITSSKLAMPVKSVLPPTQSVTVPAATTREQKAAYGDRQQVLSLPASVSLSTSSDGLTESSNNKASPAVGNFAASVARRAEERRENFESIIDESGNAKGQPTGTKIVYSAISSRNSGGVTATNSSNNNSRPAVSASMPVSVALPRTDLLRASPANAKSTTAAAATVTAQQFSASADKSSPASRSSTSIVYKATAASDDIPPPPGFDDDSRTRNGASRNDGGSTTGKSPSDNRYSAANNKSNSSVNGGVSKSSVGSKPVAGWTVNDVCAWLDSQHLFELTEMFVNHGVNGQKLLTLGRDDLVRMGIRQAGQRLTLECAIKRLAT